MTVKLVLMLALLLAVLSPVANSASTVSAQETTPSPARIAIQRLIDEAYNKGEIGVIDEIFAPTYARYPVNADQNDIKNTILALRGAIPDLQATPVLLLVEENSAALSLSIQGTLKADLVFPNSIPIPATKQPLELVINSVFIFNEQDTISIEWNAFDNLSFLANIGLMEQVAFWKAPNEPIAPVASSITLSAKDLVLGYYDAMNRGDFAFIEAQLREDFTGYNPFGVLDRAGYTADWHALYNALSNFTITIGETTAEGDWIAAVFTLTGTFDRDFVLQDGSIVPPTGGVIELTIITFHQFDAQQQLRQTREIYDGWSLLSQIKLVSGAVPGEE